jgi:hypothetical protein
MDITFDFNRVTIGDRKAFKRICGKEWGPDYDWANLAAAPAEDHAAFYFVIMRQNDPISEDSLDSVEQGDITAMFEALSASLENPTTDSGMSS